jgi:hypothetical protein
MGTTRVVVTEGCGIATEKLVSWILIKLPLYEASVVAVSPILALIADAFLTLLIPST